eukprot:scaffold27338_cov103-Phaeocystis_antarctica.AAC.1
MAKSGSPQAGAMVTRRSAPSPFRIPHCARLRSTTSQLHRINMRACPVACNKDILSRVGSTNRYSTCMEQMENALTNNSDLVSIVSHQIDIGSGHYVQRHMIMAMVDGIEISVDPLDARAAIPKGCASRSASQGRRRGGLHVQPIARGERVRKAYRVDCRGSA